MHKFRSFFAVLFVFGAVDSGLKSKYDEDRSLLPILVFCQ